LLNCWGKDEGVGSLHETTNIIVVHQTFKPKMFLSGSQFILPMNGVVLLLSLMVMNHIEDVWNNLSKGVWRIC